MHIRESIAAWSKGDYMGAYWALFWRREQCRCKVGRDILGFILNRTARRQGGYLGGGAAFGGEPLLPHGLHGVYISRYAKIGAGCRIYQNVTIGEIGGKAPQAGSHCLIGAGAILVGGIKIGDHVKIGAGAVVNTDIPSHATVVAQPARVIVREGK